LPWSKYPGVRGRAPGARRGARRQACNITLKGYPAPVPA
jgi:hypothetical protein